MRRARTCSMLFGGALGVAAAFGANAAQMQLAARDSGIPPALGDLEQFPILPREPAPAQPTITRPASAPAQTGNPLWAVPLRTLSATRERPLFSPSRRPPPAAIATAPVEPVHQAPPPVVAERPALALVGTIVGEGENIAIFYNTLTRATIRLRLGDTDDAGWKLVAVDARTTLLEKGRQSVTLALPAPNEAPVAGPAGIAVPRGADSDL